MKFDPDKPYLKKRSMSGVHFEQNGYKFNAGHKMIGKIKDDGTTEHPEEKKKDIRARAAEKIAAKKGKKGKESLEGFREKDNPDSIDSMLKENSAAKKAEELVE
jgi:hypothetical protein